MDREELFVREQRRAAAHQRPQRRDPRLDRPLTESEQTSWREYAGDLALWFLQAKPEAVKSGRLDPELAARYEEILARGPTTYRQCLRVVKHVCELDEQRRARDWQERFGEPHPCIGFG